MENNIKINKYTLSFQDSKLESQYYDNYVQNIRKPLRISILIGILIYCGFILIDYFVFPEKIFIIGLNRLIVGLIAFLTFLVTYLKNYSKYYNLIIIGLFLVVGFGTVHLTFVEQIYMNSVYSVIIFFTLVPQIRFISAILINFSIISGVIGALLIQAQTNNKLSLLQSFLLISVGIVSLLVLYIKQSIERHNFLQSNNLFVQSEELKAKNEELQTAEEELRQNNEELHSLNENIQSQKDIIQEKELRLKTIIDNQGEGFAIISLDGTFIFNNPAAEDIFDLPRNGLLGKNIADGFDKEQISSYMALINNLKLGEKETKEFYITTAKGNKKTIVVTITPDFDNENKISGLTGVFRDITEIKKAETELKKKNEELQTAEEELRQNNEELHSLNENIQSQKDIIQEKELRLKTIIDNQGEGFAIISLDGTFIFNNPAAEDIFDLPRNGLLGKNIADGFDKEQISSYMALINNLKLGEKETKEFYITTAKGNKKTIVVTITPDFDNENKISGLTGVFRDITEIKKAETELKKKNEELQDNEKELRQYNEELQATLEDLEQRKKELEKTNNTLSLTNSKLDTANKEILAGINYASYIQKSMLTSDDIIKTYLSEYFLIYKPREIVSGDFYYVNKIENYLIIAVADCTGHGVAGAFITVLGITYIHDIITRKETYSVNTVLEIVRERFKRTFATFGSDSKDGMDIALCALNLDTLVMQYSGANLPLWIVRNGDLIEHKATRCPIGFYPIKVEFVQNEIQLEKNDTIYMFSDGFQDQLGEKQLQKYQKSKFRTLILENSALSMETQKQKILDNFENWKGKNEQTDDVTVLGFKI